MLILSNFNLSSNLATGLDSTGYREFTEIEALVIFKLFLGGALLVLGVEGGFAASLLILSWMF